MLGLEGSFCFCKTCNRDAWVFCCDTTSDWSCYSILQTCTSLLCCWKASSYIDLWWWGETALPLGEDTKSCTLARRFAQCAPSLRWQAGPCCCSPGRTPPFIQFHTSTEICVYHYRVKNKTVKQTRVLQLRPGRLTSWQSIPRESSLGWVLSRWTPKRRSLMGL